MEQQPLPPATIETAFTCMSKVGGQCLVALILMDSCRRRGRVSYFGLNSSISVSLRHCLLLASAATRCPLMDAGTTLFCSHEAAPEEFGTKTKDLQIGRIWVL